ncbi:MAG: ferric reductase-like transmembrane domain-containing protein [Candidatus Dormibacteraeota bacterium]|nr:ferric reductase-like transmembrane domain-containing protein [Candidatus Dormibacteraeota bacterium]
MNDTILWYTTRASGLVSLLLLSGVAMLGLLARLRYERPGWPRFLTIALHRNLSLLAVVFLALHVVTAAVDPFTRLGLTSIAVPFGSYYRTFWLGLGAISLELLAALVATSLLRRVIGAGLWRFVHWAAYAAWPMAVLHSLGTGTDAFSLLGLGATGVSVAAVAAALMARLRGAPADPLAQWKRRATALQLGRQPR